MFCWFWLFSIWGSSGRRLGLDSSLLVLKRPGFYPRKYLSQLTWSLQGKLAILDYYILELYDSLGDLEFEKGQLWGTDPMGIFRLLLQGSFCGSIGLVILWEGTFLRGRSQVITGLVGISSTFCFGQTSFLVQLDLYQGLALGYSIGLVGSTGLVAYTVLVCQTGLSFKTGCSYCFGSSKTSTLFMRSTHSFITRLFPVKHSHCSASGDLKSITKVEIFPGTGLHLKLVIFLLLMASLETLTLLLRDLTYYQLRKGMSPQGILAQNSSLSLSFKTSSLSLLKNPDLESLVMRLQQSVCLGEIESCWMFILRFFSSFSVSYLFRFTSGFYMLTLLLQGSFEIQQIIYHSSQYINQNTADICLPIKQMDQPYIQSMFTTVLRIGPFVLLQSILLLISLTIYLFETLPHCYSCTLAEIAFIIFLIEMYASLRIMKNSAKLRRKYIKKRIQEKNFFFYCRLVWDNINIVFIIMLLYSALVADGLQLTSKDVTSMQQDPDVPNQCQFKLFSICLFSQLVGKCKFDNEDSMIIWMLYSVTVFLISILCIVTTKQYYQYCSSLRHNRRLLREYAGMDEALLDSKIYRISQSTAINQEVRETLGACSICLHQLLERREMGDQLKIMKLKCGHHFHEECIMRWVKVKDHCPYRCYTE